MRSSVSTPVAPGVDEKSFIWPDEPPKKRGIERQKAIIFTYNDDNINKNMSTENFNSSQKQYQTETDIIKDKIK